MAHRILVVCTANVCRSPMIAAMLAGRLDPARFTVDSAGVRAPQERPMDSRSADQLTARGIAVPDGTARQLDAGLVASADLVLTATRAHRADVLDLEPRSLRRTFTVLEFAALADLVEPTDFAGLVRGAAAVRTRGPHEVDLRDPIGHPAEVHAEVAGLVDAATARIAARLARLAD